MSKNCDNSERVLMFARYLVDNNATIRQVAKKFGFSKSTVHFDLNKKLKKINSKLFCDVKNILQKNFNEKHIRGGNATKNKYLKK